MLRSHLVFHHDRSPEFEQVEVAIVSTMGIAPRQQPGKPGIAAILLLWLAQALLLQGGTVLAQGVGSAGGDAGSRGSHSVSAREAMASLRQIYPAVMESRPDPATVFIFGTPMTRAGDSRTAAELWLLDHGAALNGDVLDLEELESFEISGGAFVVFRYRQWLSGAPVEQSNLRILVRMGKSAQVVLVSGRLAPALSAGVEESVVSIDVARALAGDLGREGPEWNWSDASLVARIPSGEDTETRLFWSWIVEGGDQATPVEDQVTIRADGLVELKTESLICFQDASGTVQGNSTAGMLPANHAGSEAQPLPSLEVLLDFTQATNTDHQGNFSFPGATGTPTVFSSLSGQYANVLTSLGVNLTASTAGPVSQPFDLFFNSGASIPDTAQVNTYLHVNRAHDFMKDRLPGFTAIDLPIVCNVNLSQTCNAFFSTAQLSLNFYRTGGGCSNSAYSSVIAHEYGHFVVNRLNLGQSTFGEGYSDCLAILNYDDPVVGRNFFDTGQPVRDIGTAGVTYPCAGQIHFCGQLLAGCWWDIRQNFGASLGPTVGLEAARQLFADWSAMTLGGEGGAGTAYPGTAIEVLTVDDNDGVLSNGTPNYGDICAAFLGRGIPCPEVVLLSITFPQGTPELIDPQGSTLRIAIEEVASTVVPGQVFLQYWVDGGPLQVQQFSPLVGGEYEANFPPMNCGSQLEFLVSAQDDQGIVHIEPTPIAQAGVGTALELVHGDSIESAVGWSGSSPGDTALFGLWAHGDPVGTEIQPEFDHTVDPGINCWFTGQGVVGGATGAEDVDLGVTTLTSPPFDCSQPGIYRVSYWRWFDNSSSFSPPDDDLVIQVSGDGGTTWLEAERIGPGHPEAASGWFQGSFWLNSLVSPSAQVQLRVIAEDTGNGNLVEAAIDDIAIERIGCAGGGGGGPPSDADFLRGDCNSDGGVDISDPVVLLERLFAAASVPPCEDSCDSNDDGALNLVDVVLMLEVVFGFGSGVIAEPASACGIDPVNDTLACPLPSLCP